MNKKNENKGKKTIFSVAVSPEKAPTHTPEELELIRDHVENWNPDPVRAISKGNVREGCRPIQDFIFMQDSLCMGI